MDIDRSRMLWDQACIAVQVTAMDPVGLGGIKVTARAGPVRDLWMQLLARLPMAHSRLHPNISDEALFGGIDLSMIGAQAGTPPRRQGILDQSSTLILAMAERCPLDLAGRLALALDQGRGHCLIALEEQVEPDETVPSALCDRLASHIRLDDIPIAVARGMEHGVSAVSSKHAVMLDDVSIEPAIEPINLLSMRLGIDSLRAPLLACRFARAHAVLCGRNEIEQQDMEIAAAVVLAPRAQQLPDAQESADRAEETPQQPPPEPDDPKTSDAIPQEILTDAVRVALPDGILQLSATAGGAGVGGGGARKSGNRKGRPLPARKGRPDGRSRIDVMATLRAAIPWQRLRRKPSGSRHRLALRGQDIHLKRFETCSDRLLVFVVDASGSQALARLGEAKGAVEILLSRAYASRDHAALVAFRGTSSEVLLPPTRSLVQTKKRLASLPGGGGTPLAAGLHQAGSLILQAQRQGLSPLLVLLTDGRANIALDGTAGRAQATADALDAARWLGRSKIESVILDTGIRAQPALSELARTMGGRLLTLPHAGASRISAGLEQVVRG